VASADGYLYIYDLNVTDGGECTVMKQHKLDDLDGGDALANAQEGGAWTGRQEPDVYEGDFPSISSRGGNPRVS